MKRFAVQQKKGFAMLFTVLVISLILTISLSISNITYKQGLLSGLVKDSQNAFYQADAGLECGLYWDISKNEFTATTDALGATVPPNPETNPLCGTHQMNLSVAGPIYTYTDDYEKNKSSNPCFQITIDKTNAPNTVIQSRGSNTCDGSPRQVQRALEARY